MSRSPDDPTDDRWLLRARDLLREQSQRADPTLQRQLQQRRGQVLESLGRGRFGIPRHALLATAASLLVALAIWQLPLDRLTADANRAGPSLAAPALRAESPIDQALTLPEDDLALLLGEVDDGLVEELEFYAWLELQSHGG